MVPSVAGLGTWQTWAGWQCSGRLAVAVALPKEGEFFQHKRSKKEGTHKRPKTGQAPKLRGNEAVVGVEVVVINNTKARARARAKVVVVVAVEGCLPHIVLVAVDVATTRVVGHGVL